jgi:hypothetical protein
MSRNVDVHLKYEDILLFSNVQRRLQNIQTMKFERKKKKKEKNRVGKARFTVLWLSHRPR